MPLCLCKPLGPTQLCRPNRIPTQAKHCLAHVCKQRHANTPATCLFTTHTRPYLALYLPTCTVPHLCSRASTVCIHACLHACKLVHLGTSAHTLMLLCTDVPICLSDQPGIPCPGPPHPLRTGLQDCTGSISGRSGPAHAPVPGSHPLRPAPSETPWGGGKRGHVTSTQGPLTRQPWLLAMPRQLGKG